MTNAPLLAATERRLAELAKIKETMVLTQLPRSMPKRSRSHSRKHRAIR